MHRLFIVWAITLLIAGMFGPLTHAAQADSCWKHNGSLIRMSASGNQLKIHYEAPREVLRRAGVKQGTLLFIGTKTGNRFTGKARRYSRSCPGQPLTYQVSGSAPSSQTKITLSGQREVRSRCKRTGRFKRDRLVFTYSHQC